MSRSKTEPTKRTRAEQIEHDVRQQYRDAGRLDGMVLAWLLAKKLREHHDGLVAKRPGDAVIANGRYVARVAELMLAREILRTWPKSGRASLDAAGYDDQPGRVRK